MTVTRILYFFVSYSVLWGLIQGNQPDGYLGCFEDFDGESLKSSQNRHDNTFNHGDRCKAECKKQNKRYAGTKYKRCFCGSEVVHNKIRASTECYMECPGNIVERCGGYHNSYYDRISLYDTWFCITNPCQNGATCTDINAESYNCSCSVGWTGPVCNETLTTTTSTIFPSSSTQPIGSTLTTETVTTKTTTILSSSSTQPIGSSPTTPNQPDGYLGCFDDIDRNSLNNRQNLYKNSSNNGDMCKAECKKHNKRYAGTKYTQCYCGSDVVKNMKRNSTECNQPCPGNTNETCGSYNNQLISIYDTWLCITGPCQNGDTCKDINATSYNCSCIGWTGRVCNETVTTTTSTISRSSSTQAIGSTTTAQTVTTTKTTIFSSSSTQPIGSSTSAPQPEVNKLAIYIAVPVSVIAVIVFVLIVTVLILRKRLSQNKDGRKVVNQTSANTSRSLIAVANNAYNNHDIIPLETSVNVHATEDAAIGDSDHKYYTLEQTGDGNLNNTDQRSGSALDNDDNSYGNLHVRSAALCDPTYSHTSMTGPQGTTDNTYSHIDLSVGNKNHAVMSNVDQETYNTCTMKGDVGKPRPAVEIKNDTDDTYNRLAISGKATNMGEKPTYPV